jgi:type VI secretion system protein ImpI/type VI secretion system protein
VLSKRHCVIAWRGGAWQIADTSTNGTFINRDAAPLGAGAVHVLADGDRLRLGAYEIEARIAAQSPIAAHTPPQRGYGDPFGDDPFATPAAAPPPPPEDSWFGGGNSISLPGDFDPLAPEEPLFGAPIPDHQASHHDAFRPPAQAPKLLPDDWDLSIAPAQLPPAPAPTAPPPPAPIAAPPPIPAAPATAPVAAPIHAPIPAPQATQTDSALIATFLAAAGMADEPGPADPAETMRRAGLAFRAMVAGLRQAMIARAAIKGEFRIEQTMIRARGNNPLKFSADDDDAMAALLGLGRRTEMDAGAAVADALRDIRLHEIAVMGAMQSAVRALLARLDPVALRAEAEQARSLIPAQRKARAFDAFEALHASITLALADDFDSVFGREFARAYERALSEAESRDR